MPELLDMPPPVLCRILGEVADLSSGARWLAGLRLTAKIFPALVDDAAKLAFSQRTDTDKASWSPDDLPGDRPDGCTQWAHLLDEMQRLAAPVFTIATTDVDISFPSRYSFPSGVPGTQAVSLSHTPGAAICRGTPMVKVSIFY